MNILNLYAGIGGNRKLWSMEHFVTAVEFNPDIVPVYEKLYPMDKMIEADAHSYLQKHVDEFDFIWSSPPCQSHTQMTKATRHVSQRSRYPDMSLYAEIVYLATRATGKWVVENVEPYYGILRPDGVHVTQVGRHVFWSNFPIYAQDVEMPARFIKLANMEGKRAMQEWLDIHFEENIYYEGNHCPAQILRNAVHPEIGRQVLESAIAGGAGVPQQIDQIGLFA